MTILKKVSEGAKSIGEGAKTIGKKSSDLVGSARLKYEMSKLEKEMENNISALGNCIYLQFKGEEGYEDEIERLKNATRELEYEIDDYKDQIAKLNPKPPICPSCKKEMPMGARFCWNCGADLGVPEPAPAQEEDS